MLLLIFWMGKYMRRQAIVAFLSNKCIAQHLMYLPNQKYKQKVWKKSICKCSLFVLQ